MKAGDLNAVGRGDKNNNNVGCVREKWGVDGGVARQIDGAPLASPALTRCVHLFSWLILGYCSFFRVDFCNCKISRLLKFMRYLSFE